MNKCVYCSEHRMVDNHGVCSLCDYIYASLRVMGSPKPCGEIPLMKKAEFFSSFQGLHEGSGRLHGDNPPPTVSGSGNLSDIFKLGTLDPYYTESADGAVTLKSFAISKQDFAMGELAEKRKPKACSNCALQSHMAVGYIAKGSHILACDDCFSSFLKWYGDISSVNVIRVDMEFSTWIREQGEFPPDPLPSTYESSCYGCGKTVSFTTSREPDMCDPCEDKYWELGGKVQNGFNKFKPVEEKCSCNNGIVRHSVEHGDDIFSYCSYCTRVPALQEGEEYFAYAELPIWPRLGEDFCYNGLDYLVLHVIGDKGVVVQRFYGYVEGSPTWFKNIKEKIQQGYKPEYLLGLEDLAVFDEMEKQNQEDSIPGVEDSVTWFQRISKEGF